MQHGKAVPAVLDRAEFDRRLGGQRGDGGAVRTRQRTGADQNERMFGRLERFGEFALAEIGQAFGAGAEIIVTVSQVGLFADQADREIAGAPALADAGIEHRRLAPRIGADDQQRVGALDAGDGRVEQITGAAPGRIERRAVLPGVDIGTAETAEQILERIHFLGARQIADDGADALAARGLHLGGDGGEGFVP